MKQQKTVESRVLEILKECPMSRYDDMLLILHYYNRYGYIPAGNLPLSRSFLLLPNNPIVFLLYNFRFVSVLYWGSHTKSEF